MKTVRYVGLKGRIVHLRNVGLTYADIADRVGMSLSFVAKAYKKSKTKTKYD